MTEYLKGNNMKKAILGLVFLMSIFMLTACKNQDTQAYLEGEIYLPVAMSIDSSDGVISIPFETDGDAQAIKWQSENENIVTVDENGKLVALNHGKVTITATSGQYVSTMSVVSTKDKYTDYIKINTKAEFLYIFSDPSQFNSPSKRYALATDIDFGGDNIPPIGGWDLSNNEVPIDPTRQFRATLDGRGYALKNFRIQNPQTTRVDNSYFGVSLIPFIDDGKVVNLNIIDATFIGTGFTGSIAGKIESGTIENCFVRATITSTAGNPGIPAGGIAGIIGAEATIKDVILDVRVVGGNVFAGFNFGNASHSNAISKTLADQNRPNPMLFTAISTMKGDEAEDAALKSFIDSQRIEDDDLSHFSSYSLTSYAKTHVWTIQDGFMPFIIRLDGLSPLWAKI
jgi:hypothetical protein